MNKYKIGDEIKNTVAYGDAKVTDVFSSPTTNRYVYEIEVDSSTYLAREEDLEEMFPTNH